MRSRLGGWVAAAALVLGACGSDGSTDAAPWAPDPAQRIETDLVSARDTLPPAPPVASALTVVLAHPGGAGHPGLDAAAGALAQRPDIEVRIAAAAGTGAATMSGFPVAVTGARSSDAVAAAVAAGDVDLVVVGVADGHGIGGSSAEAESAARHGVPTLLVGAEPGAPPDLAAATMQLLEVLDLELDAVLDAGAVHRLAVPSCEHGILRGRVTTRPGGTTAPGSRTDCRSTEPPARTEPDAFAAGYATLTSLG